MTPKVLVGAPCGKVPVCNEFYGCFYGLHVPPGSDWTRPIGGSVPHNLNVIVDQALSGGYSHVFIVEDDSLFPQDVVLRLLKHDVPVVAGLCRSRSAPFRSYIYKGLNENGLGWYTLTPKDSGLIKCSATGMGGILIKTDVFKSLTRPYFHSYFVGDQEWSQDIVFGKSLIDAGIDVYCDTDIIIGHTTQCVLGSERTDEGWTIVVRIDQAMVSLPQPVESAK